MHVSPLLSLSSLAVCTCMQLCTCVHMSKTNDEWRFRWHSVRSGLRARNSNLHKLVDATLTIQIVNFSDERLYNTGVPTERKYAMG